MRTIISSSRDFESYAALCQAMDSVGWIVTEVVSACSGGAHFLAEKWARANGIPVKRFTPNRQANPMDACVMRDAEMGDYAEALIALRDGDSPRWPAVMQAASAHGLRVYVHSVAARSAAV